MRADVSIVIPTLNAGESLPECLAALFEGLEASLIRELVVCDGGSHDATVAIAEGAGAVVIKGAASRGGQLRRGAEVAEGEWLLFLHADTQLEAGWSRAVRTHLGSKPKQAGWFELRFDDGARAGLIVAGWANLRARVFGLPFGDQGLLISRELYDLVGGFDDVELMEDVMMARVLGRKRLRRLPAIARTSARRYVREGWLRRGLKNLSLQIRFFAGVSPERLARGYRR